MTKRLSIGSFSRMTYLSATTLRHYHAVGLLAPAEVDRSSGYRYYTTDQVPTAHLIKRLRDLDMPVDEVKEVVAADDRAASHDTIAAHLARMEQRLRDTTDAIASLRELLTDPPGAIDVEYRTVAATPTWTISEEVALDDVGPWMSEALRDLGLAVGRDARRGPPGALYFPAFFEQGRGRVTAFVPTERRHPRSRRISEAEVPAARLAIAMHRGRFADLDRTYGALGRVVAERGVGADGPIRERFLGRDPEARDHDVQLVEVGWPIDRAEEAA